MLLEEAVLKSKANTASKNTEKSEGVKGSEPTTTEPCSCSNDCKTKPQQQSCQASVLSRKGNKGNLQ